MRKRYPLIHWRILALVLAATACSLSLRAQLGDGYWRFVTPKPFGFGILDISFANDNLGIAVGGPTPGTANNGVARTADGGATWTISALPFTNAAGTAIVRPLLTSVHMVTPTVGYIGGGGGALFKTIDGGLNWSLLNNNPFFAGGGAVNGIHFINAEVGYICGGPMSSLTSIYKTVNGGATWERETTLPAENRNIFRVKFASANLGYAVGASGTVWKYSNGIWQDFTITTALMPNSGNTSQVAAQTYRSIGMVDDSVVVVGSQNNGMIVRINTASAPAPANYQLIANGSTGFGSPAVATNYLKFEERKVGDVTHMVGAMGGFAGRNVVLIASTDNGNSFTAQEAYPGSEIAAGYGTSAVAVTPSGRFFIGGTNGAISDSMSGGTWSKSYTSYTPTAGKVAPGNALGVAFADTKYGVAAGVNGTLLTTNDGGETWVNKTANIGSNVNFEAVAYPDKDLMVLGSGSFSNPAARIYLSFDQGTTLEQVYPAGELPAGASNILDIFFLNNTMGWAVLGRNTGASASFVQLVLKTTDGGLSWTEINTLPQGTAGNLIYKIKFANANVGYAVGASGRIFKSIDGGATWTQQTNLDLAYTGIWYGLDLAGPDTVYLAGSFGRVMRTTNGGNSWSTIGNTNITGVLGDVIAYNADNAIVFASGVVHTTTNGGATWTQNFAPFTRGLQPCGALIAATGCSGPGPCTKLLVAADGRGNMLKFDADQVLPVKLSQLTATNTPQGNQLYWTALTQQEVRYYEVEASNDGLKFTTISPKIVPNAGLSAAYQWLHTPAPAGTQYYRVRATENSGHSFTTNIAVVENRMATGWKYIVMDKTLSLYNTQALRGALTVQVVNQAGQVVAAKQWHQGGGSFADMLLLPATTKGVHFVRVQNAGTVQTFKVFVN